MTDVTSTASAEPSARSAIRIARDLLALYAPLGFRTQVYVALRLLTAPMIATQRYFPESGDVLDLGCGHGIFAHLLRLGGPRRRVFGIDKDAGRIAAARRTAPPDGTLEFEVGDVREFPEGRFPVIAVVDLLHHIALDAQRELLERSVRALSPGGTIVVKDLERRPGIKYLYHYAQDWLMYGGQPLFFRSREEMVELLGALELEVEVHSLDKWRPHPHILYRCRKRIPV